MPSSVPGENHVGPLRRLKEIAEAVGAEDVLAQRLIFIGKVVNRSFCCFDKGSFVVSLSKTRPTAFRSVQIGEIKASLAARAVCVALFLPTAFWCSFSTVAQAPFVAVRPICEAPM